MNKVKFHTEYSAIIEQVNKVDPATYGSNRNYLDGSVSRLSPYISRGVISTRFVMKNILSRGLDFWSTHKFIQELAWRDYWQQVWIEKKEKINNDLKHEQSPIQHFEMPLAILNGQTGINEVDKAIDEFYRTGYMHNHMRMYVAAIACNMANAHWRIPAKWMYYHLLDADWASNALSWQWVAGSNANKKYVANQENINKYSKTNQYNTFLDVNYEDFKDWKVPDILKDKTIPVLETMLPQFESLILNNDKPTLIYNFYNIDPKWREGEDVNRVFLLEPSFFKKYPVSDQTLDFIFSLTKNIAGVQLFKGEFNELEKQADKLIFKEHPTNSHYKGVQDERDWMFSIKGYFPSFFSYWKKCKKELDEIIKD